jgi:hypothetical protein
MEVHYYVHKRPLLIPDLSQINLVNVITSYFFKLHFNIILQSMCSSPKYSCPVRSSNSTFVYISHISCVWYIPSPSHCLWFYHPNNIRWRVQIVKSILIWVPYIFVRIMFKLLDNFYSMGLRKFSCHKKLVYFKIHSKCSTTELW